LALKKGLTVINSPGSIDQNFRGEIKVILINLDKNPQTIAPCERIAQLVFSKVWRAELEEVDVISENTDRGASGFGDSGKF
jgi:dUTP pyrophosphatase